MRFLLISLFSLITIFIACEQSELPTHDTPDTHVQTQEGADIHVSPTHIDARHNDDEKALRCPLSLQRCCIYQQRFVSDDVLQIFIYNYIDQTCPLFTWVYSNGYFTGVVFESHFKVGCDVVTVSNADENGDPIPGSQNFYWLWQICDAEMNEDFQLEFFDSQGNVIFGVGTE